MGLRDRLGRLKRAASQDYISIPLEGGGVAEFPRRAAAEAFINVHERLLRGGTGDDAPPEHPLCVAARNCSDPRWRNSAYATEPGPREKIEDLSE